MSEVVGSLPLGLLKLPSLSLNSGVLLAGAAPVLRLAGVHLDFPRVTTAASELEDDVAGANDS